MSYSNVLILFISLAVVLLASGITLMFKYGETQEPEESETLEDEFAINFSEERDWRLARDENITNLTLAIAESKDELALIRQSSMVIPSWIEQKFLAFRYMAPQLRRVLPLFFGTAFIAWGVLALAGFTAWSLQFSVKRFTDASRLQSLLPPNISTAALLSAGVVMGVAALYSALYVFVKALGSVRTERMERAIDFGYALDVRGPQLERRILYLQEALSTEHRKLAKSLRLRR